MSAVVCGKRPLFDELHGSPPIQKRLRCSGNSPVRYSLSPGFPRSGSPGVSGPGSPHSASIHDLISQIRVVFPDMDEQTVEKVLVSCGNNLDSAIKCLNELRLSGDQNTCRATNDPASAQTIESVDEVQQQPEAVTASASFPDDGAAWIDYFVREMMSASDIDDARARTSRALESVEKIISSRNAGIMECLQKENETLKGQMQALLRDNQILKRAVAIQHERHLEHEERAKELQQLKQVLAQYQEKLTALEVSNYTLALHLREAQKGGSIPGRFHPDVF